MNSPQIFIMTDPSIPLFKLATKPKAEPHIFGPRIRIAPHASPSGHEQHEWHCQRCPLVKITVLPKTGEEARRQYRWAKGAQFEDDRDPECAPVAMGGEGEDTLKAAMGEG